MAIGLSTDQIAQLDAMCPASALAGGLGALINTLDGNTDEANAAKIGTLASLTTTEKETLVGAINELVTAVGAAEESTAIGTLAELTTTEKTNLVGALNELVTSIGAKLPLAGGTVTGDVTIAQTKALIAAGTGVLVGKTATEKWGFWGTTPAVQPVTQAALKADYVAADVDTAEKTAAVINAVATGFNGLLAKLKTIGLVASA